MRQSKLLLASVHFLWSQGAVKSTLNADKHSTHFNSQLSTEGTAVLILLKETRLYISHIFSEFFKRTHLQHFFNEHGT